MMGSSGSWLKILTYQPLKLSQKIQTDVSLGSDATGNNLVIKECSEFDDRVDLFYESVKHQHNFIIERKQEHLNGRYTDPRGGNYHVLTVEEDNGFQGYIVLRINRFNKEYPVGRVVDLFTDSDRSGVTNSLVQEAKYYFDKK